MSKAVVTALEFAAGVILMAVLIAAAVFVFSPAAESAKSVSVDTTANTAELKEQKYLIYDNSVVSGSQVISALRKFESQATSNDLGLKVVTGKNPVGAWYYSEFDGTKVVNSSIQDLKNTVDTTHVDYINPSGTFAAEVARDGNGVVRSITFTQQVR